jgi:hypothetical protein
MRRSDVAQLSAHRIRHRADEQNHVRRVGRGVSKMFPSRPAAKARRTTASPQTPANKGAPRQALWGTRTPDPFLTMEVLYRLS